MTYFLKLADFCAANRFGEFNLAFLLVFDFHYRYGPYQSTW